MAPMDQEELSPAQPPEEEGRFSRHPGAHRCCAGCKPRLAGQSIMVRDVALWHERMGMSVSEIVKYHPAVTPAAIHAALAYYHDHRGQIDADLNEAAAPSRVLFPATSHDPFIEMMADEPELMEEITEEAMSGETRPLRSPSLG